MHRLHGAAALRESAFPQLDGPRGVRGSGPARAQGTTKPPLTWETLEGQVTVAARGDPPLPDP
jgi:hypothetical protein